jgi:hypothetical protein
MDSTHFRYQHTAFWPFHFAYHLTGYDGSTLYCRLYHVTCTQFLHCVKLICGDEFLNVASTRFTRAHGCDHSKMSSTRTDRVRVIRPVNQGQAVFCAQIISLKTGHDVIRITTTGGNKEFVLFKDVNFVQSFNPDDGTTGAPRYYAQFDIDNMILGPTPDAAYPVELHYFYRPASLTAGAEDGTTWLSSNASVSMLYGSLVEAYTFMKGEADLVQNYTQRFTEALSRVKNFGESQEVTDAYRTGLILREKT